MELFPSLSLLWVIVPASTMLNLVPLRSLKAQRRIMYTAIKAARNQKSACFLCRRLPQQERDKEQRRNSHVADSQAPISPFET